MINDNTVYWLWLQRKLGIPTRQLSAVLDMDGGAREIYESTNDRLWKSGRFSVQSLNSLGDRDLSPDEKVLQSCRELGYDILTPDQPEYPERLKTLPDSPAALFVKGRLPRVDRTVCIAIVGTRKATEYGASAARELSRRLTKAGAVVVSGGAVGIDTAAHTGALEAGGATIAVLGCGINYRYNMENAALRERIAEKGAVISEYPPGTTSFPQNFPIRNRIIAGLCLGTVVMEAGAKSGSLITAGLALEQGRDVFAVPMGLGTANSAGVHSLLRDGAIPVRSPLDILMEYVPMFPNSLSIAGAERPLMSGREPQRITEEPETDIYTVRKKPKPVKRPEDKPEEPLPESAGFPEGVSEKARELAHYLRSKPKLADELAREAGIGTAEAMTLLTELELFGCVKACAGGRYSV